jgi:hypothetical protein
MDAMSDAAVPDPAPPRLPARLQAVLLVALALAALWPSLEAGFFWDDIRQIVDSTTIDDPGAPLRYLSLNVAESRGETGRGGDGVDTYRPMFFVALWLIHRVNGADPFWFHLAVVAAHLAVCLLLWVATRRFVGSDLAAAAVFAAFAIHPVTAEGFLWASAISEPLSAAGLLGAVLILDRWGREPNPRAASLVAGLVMLAGLLSKEVVIGALPAVSLYMWRVRGVRPAALVGPWVAAAVFLALRVNALDGLQATGAGLEQRLAALRNLPVLVVDGLVALVTLRPVGVRHLYWDYRELGWTESAVAALAVLAMAAVAWRARRRLPLLPTALAVTVCMLAPVALVTTAPGWGGFGRYLYLPWGFLLLAAGEAGRRLAPRLREGSPRLIPIVAVATALFLALELVGLGRALEVYRSPESLARAAVELQPHAPEGWEWLGNHELEAGDLAAAAACYREAVAIEPSILRPRHNLAAALLFLGQPAEALDHARAVAELHGVAPDGAWVAASACLELGRREEAGRWIELGLAEAPADRRLLELRSRWLDPAPTPTP